jgi:hypothetical protein
VIKLIIYLDQCAPCNEYEYIALRLGYVYGYLVPRYVTTYYVGAYLMQQQRIGYCYGLRPVTRARNGNS